MLEFAKSQLEWMAEGLSRSLGHTRDNPFNTRWAGPGWACIADTCLAPFVWRRGAAEERNVRAFEGQD